MTVVSIISFLVCLLIIASWFRRGVDVLSPGRVFCFVWCMAIGMADLKLSRLQDSWSIESWLFISLGLLSFLCGLYVAHVIELRSNMNIVSIIRQTWSREDIDEKRLFTAISILFLLFLLAYAVIYSFRQEIPLFSERPGLARLNFQIFGIGLFLHNVVFIVFFSLLYFLLVKRNRPRKLLLALFSLVSLALYGMTLQRFQIVMAAVMCVLFLYYTTNLLKFSRVALFFTLATLFFLSVSTLRGGELFIQYLYLNSQMKFAPQFAILTEPYMYLVMNLEVFAQSVDKLEEFSKGVFTFDFIFALTGIKHMLREYFGFVEAPYNILGFNTYTALWTYYRDFGLLGLATFPFLLGGIVGSLYHSMKRCPSLQTISFYCLSLFTMIFSFYHNFLSFLWYEYNLIGFYVIFKLVRSRRGGGS